MVNPLLVIDAANVVGSVPDGWWLDRHGATVRLRDSLAPLAATGLETIHKGLRPPLDLLLVVEGKARGVPSIDGVPVYSAPGSGDDAIVEVVRASQAPIRVVVTADRGLRERVRAQGADVIGPSAVR